MALGRLPNVDNPPLCIASPDLAALIPAAIGPAVRTHDPLALALGCLRSVGGMSGEGNCLSVGDHTDPERHLTWRGRPPSSVRAPRSQEAPTAEAACSPWRISIQRHRWLAAAWMGIEPRWRRVPGSRERLRCSLGCDRHARPGSISAPRSPSPDCAPTLAPCSSGSSGCCRLPP